MVVVLMVLVEVCQACIASLHQVVDLLGESRLAKGRCLNNEMSDSFFHWNKKLLRAFFQLINSSSLDLCVR